MVKVVTIENMRRIEQEANNEGISFDTMFDRVAQVVTSHITGQLLGTPDPRICILVGSGNNGSDGLVTARQLLEADLNCAVNVYLTKPRPGNDPHLKALENTDCFIAKASDDQQHRVLRNMVASADIVIDAILGIGTRLPLGDDLQSILQNVHQALQTSPTIPEAGLLIESDAFTPPHTKKPHIIALDCPSGVNCDTGETDPNTLHADETITFIAVKRGLVMQPAAAYVGKLHVATLGIPEKYTRDEPIKFAHAAYVATLIPKHMPTSHKGTHGKTLIVAGSVNYTGAAGLAAQAAYRGGAGLVTLAAPMPVIAGLAAQLLEPTWILLPHDMGVISEAAAEVLLEELQGYSALLLGPGLGQEDTTKDFVITLLQEAQEAPNKPESKRSIGFAALQKDTPKPGTNEAEKRPSLPPLVIDADALNLLSTVEDWPKYLPESTILTPHPGEMARLCQLDTEEVQAHRADIAAENANKWQAIVVLKGAHTVIASPQGEVTILPFKTAALATAGTGDVLAGVIVSLLGQGLPPYEAAVAGAYLHGSAGVLAAEVIGNPNGVIASDVLEFLSDVLGEFI